MADTALLRLLPFAAILVVAAAGAVWFRDELSFEMLRERHRTLVALRDASYPATVALFLAAYVGIVALSLPGATAATLTGGFLFGVFPGTLYNVAAATVGACLIFLAARFGPGERLAARMDAASGRVKRLKEGLDENQVPVLFLMRLVPVVPFFVANLVPAFMGVSLARFAVTTFLGIIPGALVYTSVGAGLSGVFARDESPDLGVIFEPRVLLPLLGLAALAALPIAVRLVRGRG